MEMVRKSRYYESLAGGGDAVQREGPRRCAVEFISLDDFELVFVCFVEITIEQAIFGLIACSFKSIASQVFLTMY